MPSSTNRDTYVERKLTEYFRRVYVHLYISGAGKALHYCTTGFKESLDLPPIALRCTLTFSPHPCFPETHKVAAIMRSRVDISGRMSYYARFNDASSACWDMGELLIKYGRTGEGQFWCNWARVFHGEGYTREQIEMALVEARERGEVLTVADVLEQMAIEADVHEQVAIEADMHEQMAIEADVHEQMPVDADECEKGPVEEIECEQMLTEEANHRQRLMLADEQGMPATSNKQGKMPMMSNKHGKRPMEVDETACRDQAAVKRAKTEHIRHVVVRLSEQLNERPPGHLSVTDKTHGHGHEAL
jgi:hypothetical protein